MKKIYHLSSCDTNRRILKELDPPAAFKLQDIKMEGITEEQIDEMKELAGSYEALFSKRARRYREKELHLEELTEDQYRNLILEHYTFLKRPVIINNDDIFIGNLKKTIEAAKNSINE
ncbi:arsenate reductase family protein [Salegentibacter sp. F14]